MTAKERAEKVVADFDEVIVSNALPNWEQKKRMRQVLVAITEKAIEAAILEERQRIVKFIKDQNAMVNSMFDNPGRHDAFVRDIVEAVERGQS